MRLANKVAIVTGGGSGIGKAIAAAFVREGCKVIIAGRNQEKLSRAAKEIGAGCIAVAADIGNPQHIQPLVQAAVDHFGRIDILVNNAAVLLAGSAESLSEQQWEQTLNINVLGVWRLSRAVLPHLSAAGGGSIINMGSVLSML